MASPTLVGATDLAAWATRRDAQERLPQLVRRLVLTTAPRISRIHFAAGEGVLQPGWDGITLVVDGNAFVPTGQAVWELGTNRDPRSKAEEDYKKRTENPNDVNPAETTFVFVTPRRWETRPSKDDWASQKTQEGVWREVRVYDADDLETWLEMSPGVHAWISDLLGKIPDGVEDLEAFWIAWSGATRPVMSPELVLAGREAIADQILDQLRAADQVVSLSADSTDEALAVLAASVQRLPDGERELIHARALVISHEMAWRWAVRSETSLLLIPTFQNVDIAAAQRGKHGLFVPLGREVPITGEITELPRIRRDPAKTALVKMGVTEERAEELASLARAGLLPLRRKLALSTAVQRPAWASGNEARVLIPALLASAWDESSEGDRNTLASLGNVAYEQLASEFSRLATQSDPPLRQVGTIWGLVSKENAWALLSPHLNRNDVERYELVLSSVLGTIDPVMELPPNERWMANVLDRKHPLSGHVREGLVDTLAILGGRAGEVVLRTGGTGQDHAAAIVHGALTRANGDGSGRLWASLAWVLPLLAEAAPETFLDGLERGLDENENVLGGLFTDSDQSAVMFGSSPHTGLLWALESLAWSPEHLGRVATLLARLARLDPGGKLSNRPDKSLRAIFLLWHPQTSAPISRCLSILDELRTKYPGIAWSLLLNILPRRGSIGPQTHTPRWRNWKPDTQVSFSSAEFWQAVETVIDWLIVDAGTSGRRWSDLVKQLSDFPAELQERAVDRLEIVASNVDAIDDQQTLRSALRVEIAQHRSFPDAEWRMPKAQLDRLASVYSQLEPIDLVERYAWLFSPRPPLLEGEPEDWQTYQANLFQAQDVAILSILDQGGLQRIIDLASAVEWPLQLGRSVARTRILPPERERDLLALLGPVEVPGGRLLALGYVEGSFQERGWDWADAYLRDAARNWDAQQRADFLIALPPVPETWDWAERFDAATEQAFWQRTQLGALDDSGQVQRAGTKLLEHGRPIAALQMTALSLNARAIKVDPQLAVEVLHRAVRGEPDQHFNPGMLAYEVTSLLDYIEKSGTVDASRVAQLEWDYLPLLEGSRRPPKILHGELAKTAAFFVEVVSWVFRAEDDDSDEVSDEERIRAKLGYGLLDSWRRVPGLADDGSLDEAELNSWVDEARGLLSARGRARIGDQRIGQILRYAPEDADGTWPPLAVRKLIERLQSEHLEKGLSIETRNSRGMTTRGLTEGGVQERTLTKKYLAYAQSAADRWPRTGAMLRRIASSYAREAQLEDFEAELTEDRWR